MTARSPSSCPSGRHRCTCPPEHVMMSHLSNPTFEVLVVRRLGGNQNFCGTLSVFALIWFAQVHWDHTCVEHKGTTIPNTQNESSFCVSCQITQTRRLEGSRWCFFCAGFCVVCVDRGICHSQMAKDGELGNQEQLTTNGVVSIIKQRTCVHYRSAQRQNVRVRCWCQMFSRLTCHDS